MTTNIAAGARRTLIVDESMSPRRSTSLMARARLASLAALLSLCAAPSWAQSWSQGQLYTSVGTQGISVGYASVVENNTGFRMQIGAASGNRHFDSDNISYSGSVRLANASLLGDWYFGTSGFRFSAGGVVNQSEWSASAETASGTTMKLGSTSYSGVSVLANGRLSKRRFDPYVGLGWGIRPDARRGFGVNIDLGMQYQTPSTELTVSKGSVSAADLEAERSRLDAKLKDAFRLYPVLSIGLTYTF